MPTPVRTSRPSPVVSTSERARTTLPAQRIAVSTPIAPGYAAGASGFDFTGLPAVHAPIQRKAKVNAVDDDYEREADAVADRVMRMTQPTTLGTAPVAIQRKCEACEDEEKKKEIQTKRAPSALGTGALDTRAAVSATAHGGQALPSGLRAYFEPRFGVDFARVRIHTDGAAANAARSVQARAYTLGRDVVFGAGEYAPASAEGRRLIAHELAHVVQQGAARAKAGAPVKPERASDGAESSVVGADSQSIPHSTDTAAVVRPQLADPQAEIQRKEDVEDFRVTQLQDKPEKRTVGLADRFFFELDRSDYDDSVPGEAAERARLEAWAKAHAGKHVNLVARTSQEGDPAHNQALASERAATVRKVLVAGGVIVDGVRIDATFSERPVDYRFYRSVEAIVAGSGEVACGSFTTAQQNADIKDCESALADAHKRADEIAKAAIVRLRPADDPATKPDRDSVLATRFPGVTRATLLPRFESVVKRIGEVGPGGAHTCNHRCAPDCERAASAAPGGPVELCAPFYVMGFRGQTISLDERVFALMHESTHSAVAPGSGTASVPAKSVGIDFAYSKTRLFGVLKGSEALENTDSYVVTLLTLARDAGSAAAVLASRGVPPVDDTRLVTPTGSADRNQVAQRAIGFAESWLNYASFWTPNAYDFVAASLAAWGTGWLGGLGHQILELYAPLFRLAHPGAAALDPPIVAFQAAVAGRGFPTPPITRNATQEDRTRLAGIYDRLTRMHRLLGEPLVIDRATSGDGTWSKGTGLPGIGTTVMLADSFFALAAEEQARHSLRLMARAMSDVGTTWVEAYVEAADGVRKLRGLGP